MTPRSPGFDEQGMYKPPGVVQDERAVDAGNPADRAVDRARAATVAVAVQCRPAGLWPVY